MLDDFGEQLGLAWRETDEADTELEKLIENLLAGQYANPIRIVAFNTVEGWSRDVTKEIALEAARSLRPTRRGAVLTGEILGSSWAIIRTRFAI